LSFVASCFPDFIQSTAILNQFSTDIKRLSKTNYKQMAKKPWSPLRRLRTLQQLTQKELAEALGVTQDTVANWESGRAVPRLTIPQFKMLLKVLQVTPEELPDDFSPPRSPSEDKEEN
jgi:DNA-binding transcriptional regulator YiaG